MLTRLSIKDFAIIDSVSLDFHQGFHIFTGETGAGKSILIEAISLALGSRADTAYVRSGKEKAIIELSAVTSDSEVLLMLKENGFEVEGSEIALDISREIQSEGRNTCRLNGTLVSVSFLSKLCKKIADIHGQYDHQSLLDPEQHIVFLDSFGGSLITTLKASVSEDYQSFSKVKQQLDLLVKSQSENARQADFMRFELSEIQAAAPIPDEDTELSDRLSVIQNSELIFNRLSETYLLLFEGGSNPSAIDGLGRSLQLIEEAAAFSQEIKGFSEELSDCFYKLEELRAKIRTAKDSVSYSTEDLDQTIQRLDLLSNLKKKYGGSLEKVLEYKEELIEKLSNIENSDELIATLREKLAEQEKKLQTSSSALSEARKQVSLKMEAQITRELEELHFKDAKLFVEFKETAPGTFYFTENGIDTVEFLLITNKGEFPKPLVKVASGGEISRIMLAFKSVIGDYAGIPTMLFDEIDSGISGLTASVVGKKLKQLSDKHQVICITHLAQIAAFSDHHYQILKEEHGERTESRVTALDQNGKTNEIARLLGGMNITETTIKNAEEIIAEALK
ncbi:MAG: DNA repair protein RecN [Eubacteriales bacterium]|nr:DNA repair protein RecN [Eubacteriales bacterium]MDD3349307.1 DNA repair protein RecN [Eubacteriales bacterium]